MSLAEFHDLHEIFFIENATGWINYFWILVFQVINAVLKNQLLDPEQFLQPVSAKFPFQVRIFAYNTRSRTRNIKKDPVAALFQLFAEFGFVVLYLIILNACSLKSLFGLQKYRFSYIMDKNLTCIMHKRRKRQTLTSWSTAIVKHGLPWFHVHSHREKLTRFILHLKMAFLILHEFE